MGHVHFWGCTSFGYFFREMYSETSPQTPVCKFFMRLCLLLLLAIFGFSFFSSTSGSDNLHPAVEIPLIDYGAMLPNQLWRYLFELLDVRSANNMAQTCRKFYEHSKKSRSLHIRRVQNGLNAILSIEDPRRLMKHYCLLDLNNSFFRLLKYYLMEDLSLSQKETFRHAVLLVSKLKLPKQYLTVFEDDYEKYAQMPQLKELSMSVSLKYIDTIDFKSINSAFGGIETLYLNLHLGNWKMPFNSEDVFSAMPKLQKLFIRIVRSEGLVISREDLVTFLEILKDNRIFLKIDTHLNLKIDTYFDLTNCFKPNAITAVGIFNSELKDMNERFNMKDRLSLHFNWDPEYLTEMLDISNLIHSIVVEVYGRTESLDGILTSLTKFKRLEKLKLSFTDNTVTLDQENFKIDQISPFTEVVDLRIICNDEPCLELLKSLHVIFPNVKRLTLWIRKFQLNSYSGSLIKLRNLETLSVNTDASKREFYDLITAIGNGAFPKLRRLGLPDLNDEDSDISFQEFKDAYYKCVNKNPSLFFNCRHY